MARRRRVLMGMGALVFGSGAMSVNAALQDSVNPASDMRVVFDGDADLTLQPGAAFRNGGNVDGKINNVPNGPNGTDLSSRTDSNNLFGNSINNGGASFDDSSHDLPAAAINENENNSLGFEVAVPFDDSGDIGNQSKGVLQVENNTAYDYDIGIEVDSWGSDQGSNSGEVGWKNIVRTYKFIADDGGSNRQISPDTTGYSPKNKATVKSGNYLQIYLKYNTEGSPQKDDLHDAAYPNGPDPFSQSQKNLDLIDKIQVNVYD